MTATSLSPNPMLHVRFAGYSWDLPLNRLDLGPFSSDEEVRAALALFLNVMPVVLASYVVERHPNGNFTVRPEAVFG